MLTALALATLCLFGADLLAPDPPAYHVPGMCCRSVLRAAKEAREETVRRRACCASRRAEARPPRPAATPPPPLYSMAGAVELQLCRDRWQEFLQPHHIIRVWRASSMDLLAELPVPLVVQIVTHYLSQAGLTAAVLGLQALERKPLASAPPRADPPRVGAPPKAVQAARRAARISRAGRAGRKPGSRAQIDDGLGNVAHPE